MGQLTELIARAMADLRLSVPQLEDASGVSDQQIRRILRGKSRPRDATLAQLEEALGCKDTLFAARSVDDADAKRDPHDLTGTWYELIAKQADRGYESVDEINIAAAQARPGRIEAEFRRVHSTRRRGDIDQQWGAVGTITENRFIYLAFYSLGPARPESNGVIAMRRDPERFDRMVGHYLRFRPDDTKEEVATPPVYDLVWSRSPSEIADDPNCTKWTGGLH